MSRGIYKRTEEHIMKSTNILLNHIGENGAWNKGIYGTKRKQFEKGEAIDCIHHGLHKNWYFNKSSRSLACRYCVIDRNKTFAYNHPFMKFLIWAKGRSKECNIDEAYIAEIYLQQNGLCALSGIDLDEENMSVDRIDSTKGYIKGNIQWVDFTVNRMKSDIEQNKFIKLCEMIAARRMRKYG